MLIQISLTCAQMPMVFIKKNIHSFCFGFFLLGCNRNIKKAMTISRLFLSSRKEEFIIKNTEKEIKL